MILIFTLDFKPYLVSSLNYVEFLSWISAGIITLIGLLTVFISVHYQDYILKSKELIWKLNYEEMDLKGLISYLHEYEFRWEGLDLYNKAVSIYKYMSWCLTVLWFGGALVYFILEPLSFSRFIIAGSYVLFVFILWRIYFLFRGRVKKPQDINTLLDAGQLNVIYAYGTSIFQKILKPAFAFNVSRLDSTVEITYSLPISMNNYSIILYATKDFKPYLHIVYKSKKKSSLEMIREKIVLDDLKINKMLYENINNYTFAFFIRYGESDEWEEFTTLKEREESDQIVSYTVNLKEKKDYSQVPRDAQQQLLDITSGTMEYWIRPEE